VIFLGPPGTGKTHLVIGLAVRAGQAGHRVLFATAAEWVRRAAAGRADPAWAVGGDDQRGSLAAGGDQLEEQVRGFCPERMQALRERWGEVFGGEVAAAMIDRLVHHAEAVAFKGDSYRLKDRDLGRVPAAATDEQ
jgi:DNA replication protein DnaC